MEFDLNREHFSNDNFDCKSFLNTLLAKSTENESEIISFKLKIIQREFTNEIELNTNNLLKSSKTIEDDLKTVNALNRNLIEKITDIGKHKKIKDQDTSSTSTNSSSSNYIIDLERAAAMKKANRNLTKAISLLENKKTSN